MRTKVLWCLFVLSMVASTAAASNGTLNWNYQSTGFLAGGSGLGPQTALAMRDGKTWPVIFSYGNSSSVNAYSLYPVSNPIQGTAASNWHQIGTGLLYTSGAPGILSAATSPTGSVGVVARSPSPSYPDYNSVAVVGSSSAGWGSTMHEVRAIDFDAQGHLITGTMNTIPSSFSPMPLVDIDVSPTGEIGAIDAVGCYYQKLAWTGTWEKQILQNLNPSATPIADLALDSLSRPHVVSLMNCSDLVASDFDVMSGRWTSQLLSSASSYAGAAVAADDLGGVGAAWVVQDFASGHCKLMYAYKNGTSGWATHEVTTGVPPAEPVLPGQRVGLAFDANNFPVISFVTGPGNIWLAYDPVAVPEPSTLLLIITGGLFSALAVGKSQWRRLRK